MEKPNVVTLDQDSISVRRLSLAALQAAGNGKGKLAPKAHRAYQAYTVSIAAGESETAAIKAALSVLEERR